MQSIDAENAESYLRSRGLLEPNEQVAVRELEGGVSNLVLQVFRQPPLVDFVVKQARPQLRVADPWFCSVERIWREVAVMKIYAQILDRQPTASGLSVRTPDVLYCDRDNYLFTMTAAPPHQVWKQQLLAGETDPGVAAACGRLLGSIHAATWQDAELASAFGEQTFFQDLRVEPYYRHVANKRADLSCALTDLCNSLERERSALVHGDFSPKNLLVSANGLMLLDFEVGHFGDPAFDLGFFLSHLSLKAIKAAPRSHSYVQLASRFCEAYQQPLRARVSATALEHLRERGITNLAACMLARVDGKSRVEYLDRSQQEQVRRLASQMLISPPSNWDEAFDRLE